MFMLTKRSLSSRLRRSRLGRRGGVLLEVALAMGFTAVVALFIMRASLLALSGNQWTIMQTLTDAYLSRETALSNRVPVADLTSAASLWPEQADSQTVTLGRIAGGKAIDATLTRFRVTQPVDPDSAISAWRLHSVLAYRVDGKQYVKSCSTLRMQ